MELKPDGRIEWIFALHKDPLAWPEVDTPPGERFPPMPLTFEQSFYEFICGPRNYHRNLDRFVETYRRVTAAERDVPFRYVPDEPRLVNRLLLPLRHAKASLVLGNLLGSIALSGMVAEMAAIVMLELADLDDDLRARAQALRAGLSRPFDECGQGLRVDLLATHDLINDQQKDWFGSLRGVRRMQLHFLDQEPPTEPQTIAAYKAARGLFATTIGNDITSQSLELKPSVIALLRKNGLLLGPDGESL